MMAWSRSTSFASSSLGSYRRFEISARRAPVSRKIRTRAASRIPAKLLSASQTPTSALSSGSRKIAGGASGSRGGFVKAGRGLTQVHWTREAVACPSNIFDESGEITHAPTDSLHQAVDEHRVVVRLTPDGGRDPGRVGDVGKAFDDRTQSRRFLR